MAARAIGASLLLLGMGLLQPGSANPRYWCGGHDVVPCPDGYVCDLRTYNCAGIGIGPAGSGLIGVCIKQPEKGKTCPLGTHEVCGCNGNTHENDCERVLAGESKSSDGACNN